jgi:hypothetical protein
MFHRERWRVLHIAANVHALCLAVPEESSKVPTSTIVQVRCGCQARYRCLGPAPLIFRRRQQFAKHPRLVIYSSIKEDFDEYRRSRSLTSTLMRRSPASCAIQPQKPRRVWLWRWQEYLLASGAGSFCSTNARYLRYISSPSIPRQGWLHHDWL